ncbi:MAG: substrate-binding domain-containing protein [Gammaproteobacteria bacterium]
MEKRDHWRVEDDLPWPVEAARTSDDEIVWNDGRFNHVLDFHGDPLHAGAVVLSDGNHHMALEETLRAFVAEFREVGDVFYVTLPPSVLLPLFDCGLLRLGNLCLPLRPNVFISPMDVLERLVERGRLQHLRRFARSRGCALLVNRGNPRSVSGLPDLFRADIRVFISNPERERASFNVYRDTLYNLAQAAGLDADKLSARLESGAPNCMHGQRVHHREAPTALAAGRADVAVLYHHLALRYVRAFPDRFEMVPLPGSTESGPFPQHVITSYGIGLVGGGGAWGAKLQQFVLGQPTAAIYRAHGLDAPVTD